MMKSGIALAVILVSVTNAVVRLRKESYTRLPYQYVNGDPTNARYGMFQDAAVKAAYHAVDKILYVASGRLNEQYLHVIDMNNPAAPKILMTHDFNDDTHGNITDVEACTDTIAVSLSNAELTNTGHVVLFKPYNRADQDFVSVGTVPVGVQPKDMAYTSDCTRLVVVNEGRGTLSTTTGKFVDPEGSMTVIVRNDQGFPPEINVDFTQFFSNNDIVADYVKRGVRYVFRGMHVSGGPVNTFSQDLEPESVTISSDDRFAFVSMQENNAILKFDLTNFRIIDFYPLGAKNWTSFDIDASDINKAGNLRRHNVYSFYQPGKLTYGVVDGKGYVISADTGKVKQYTSKRDGYDFNEAVRSRVAFTDGDLDSVTIPSELQTQIQDNNLLGRVHMSRNDGQNIYQKIEDIFLYGGRGFSLWAADTMAHVFDSGDDLERHWLADYSQTFNGECSSGSKSPTLEVDARSDDMGPEPTMVAAGEVGMGSSKKSILIVAARYGVLYTFSMRGTSATFESTHREGQINDNWNNLYFADAAGDQDISDMGFIPGSNSSTGDPLVYVIGRATGSVSIYSVHDETTF